MHKQRLDKYSAILAEYNPAIKEKRAIDQRFGKLETSMGELKSMISGLIAKQS